MITFKGQPVGPKRIRERLGGDWFVFGAAKDGTVDIADLEDTIFSGVTREAATRLIAARDAFLGAVAAEIESAQRKDRT